MPGSVPAGSFFRTVGVSSEAIAAERIFQLDSGDIVSFASLDAGNTALDFDKRNAAGVTC